MANNRFTTIPATTTLVDLATIQANWDKADTDLDTIEAAAITESTIRSAADNAETAARIAADSAHASSTTAHNATAVVFTPASSGIIATNVDAAVKEVNTRVNTILQGSSGTKDAELTDIRTGADSVARATAGDMVREIHAMMIAAATVSSTLTHGLQQIIASQAGPMIPTIYGRTLVNIINGGDCETLTGWTLAGVAPILSTTQKRSGTSSIKCTNSGVAPSYVHKDFTYPLDTTKQYMIGLWAYIESRTTGSTPFIELTDVGTFTTRYTVPGSSVVGSWQFIYMKIPTSNTLVGAGFRVLAGLGSVGDCVAYIDSIRLYEVSSTLYAAIGTTYTATTSPSIDDILPHVNSIKHIQNPAVIKTGKNLFPPFTELTLKHANATVIEPYELTLNGVGINNDSYVEIPALKNTSCTFSLTHNGHIYIYTVNEDNSVSPSPVNGSSAQSFTFTTSATAKYIKIYCSNIATGAFTFTNPMLELGSSATAFEPQNNDHIYGITDQSGNPIQLGSNMDGTVVDSLRVEGGAGHLTKRWMKDIALDGSLAWNFPAGGDFAGFKQVRATISGFVANVGYAIKYNGNPLVTAPNSTSWETQADKILMHTDGYIYILISDIDSGWGETYSPASEAEIDAYFNGWKMNNGTFGTNYDGTGTKTWIPWNATDNTGAVTVVPTTVSTAISGGTYDYYRLSYQLATTVEEIVTVEGSIGLHSGGNQIEVLEGVVVREVAIPKYRAADNAYRINHIYDTYNGSQLINRAYRILKVYKNGIEDKKWSIRHDSDLTYVYGTSYAHINAADFDPTAQYTVTYIALDKYLMTANVTSVLAEYQSNPRMSIDALVRSMADVETEASIIKLLLGSEYTKSGGKRIQTGTSSGVVAVAGTAVTVNVTFPIAYASAPVVNLSVTGSTVGTAGYNNVEATSITTTGFVLKFNSYVAQTLSVNWEAIGK